VNTRNEFVGDNDHPGWLRAHQIVEKHRFAAPQAWSCPRATGTPGGASVLATKEIVVDHNCVDIDGLLEVVCSVISIVLIRTKILRELRSPSLFRFAPTS